MVNNSTNINKTNNHLSPKESLNSDGQQFHQYQQSPHTLTLIILLFSVHMFCIDIFMSSTYFLFRAPDGSMS